MYTFDSRIRYSEIGRDGKLKPEALIDYFQDASTFHSEDIGVGMDYLSKLHMAWVLSAWQIVIERYPAVGERVVIGTCPYEFKGFFGMRNFLMQTVEGEVLAYANSIWTLLDFEKMFPARPTKEMLEKYVLEERYPMDYAPRKVSVNSEGEKKEEIVVKPHHLDTNEHVNNGQYVRMALEFLPEDEEVTQIRVEYKKAAVLGNTISPVVHREGNLLITELNETEGSAYAIVELTTKKKDEK